MPSRHPTFTTNEWECLDKAISDTIELIFSSLEQAGNPPTKNIFIQTVLNHFIEMWTDTDACFVVFCCLVLHDHWRYLFPKRQVISEMQRLNLWPAKTVSTFRKALNADKLDKTLVRCVFAFVMKNKRDFFVAILTKEHAYNRPPEYMRLAPNVLRLQLSGICNEGGIPPTDMLSASDLMSMSATGLARSVTLELYMSFCCRDDNLNADESARSAHFERVISARNGVGPHFPEMFAVLRCIHNLSERVEFCQVFKRLCILEELWTIGFVKFLERLASRTFPEILAGIFAHAWARLANNAMHMSVVNLILSTNWFDYLRDIMMFHDSYLAKDYEFQEGLTYLLDVVVMCSQPGRDLIVDERPAFASFLIQYAKTIAHVTTYRGKRRKRVTPIVYNEMKVLPFLHLVFRVVTQADGWEKFYEQRDLIRRVQKALHDTSPPKARDVSHAFFGFLLVFLSHMSSDESDNKEIYLRTFQMAVVGAMHPFGTFWLQPPIGKDTRASARKQITPLGCVRCGIDPVKSKCSRCLLVSYCSSDCQTKHWALHKHCCKIAVPVSSVEK